MDDVQFESLASVLEREGPLPADRALALIREAARSLAEAHAAGILHCDVQPATLLVTSEGRVLLAESTLARRQGEARQPDTPETERLVAPCYYPPEVSRAGPLDTRSDLFLLGATFYHVMSGHPPFDGPDPETRALQYIRKDVPPLDERVPGTPVLVNVLLQKLLRRNPAERYQTAEELLAVVERAERMLQKRQAVRRAAPAPAKEAQPEAHPKTRRLPRSEPAAEPEARPKTRRLKPAEAGPEESTPARRPTTARHGVAAKPLWQSKAFLYCAAAGGTLLVLVVILLLLPGRRKPPALAHQNPVVPAVSTAVEPTPKVGEPKEKPKETPKEQPAPKPPKATPEPQPAGPEKSGPRWAKAKGTMTPAEEEEYKKKLEAIELSNVEDYIWKWQYAGPYREPGKQGPQDLFDIVFPPEKELSAALPANEAPEWKPLPTRFDPGRPGVFDFKLMDGISAEHVAIYLRTRVQSPMKQDVEVWAGSDDGIRIWLNRQHVHGNNAARAINQDSDKVKVTLNQGWNDVLVKITQGTGDWGFCLRFRTLDGQKVDGLKADPAGK